MTLCKHRMGQGGQDDKDGDGDQGVPGDMLSEKLYGRKIQNFAIRQNWPRKFHNMKKTL